MLCPAAGREENQPLWSREAPQGDYSRVLEGPGTVGAGGGRGVLGGRQQEQRPGWNHLEGAASWAPVRARREEEAELVRGVPTGGEQGRERPGQKQTGLAQHAALLDRIAQLCNREQCPLSLSQRPSTTLPHPGKQRPSLTQNLLHIPGFGSSWAWAVWSREGD